MLTKNSIRNIYFSNKSIDFSLKKRREIQDLKHAPYTVKYSGNIEIGHNRINSACESSSACESEALFSPLLKCWILDDASTVLTF